MGEAKDDVLAAGPESARIVLVREGRSQLIGTGKQNPEEYGDRALAVLLRERWAIRSTVPTAGGTYVVLGRGRALSAGESDEPPSSRSAGPG